VEVKDTTSGPPVVWSGRLTGRGELLLLDGDGLSQDALKIQERNLAEDVAARGKKSNLQYVVGVSIMSETTTLSPSLSLSLALSLSLPPSLSDRTVSAQQAARTLRLVSPRGAGERRGTRWRGDGGGGGGAGGLDLDGDAERLFLLIPTILTESFPKPSLLPVRRAIIDVFFFFFFLLLFFLLLKGGGLTFPNSTLMKEARLLMLYYRASPERVDGQLTAQRGPLEEDDAGMCA